MVSGQNRLRIAVLMASHNRRDTTVRAVESVRAARDIADIQVVLLDDGSNDNTDIAVASADPTAIIIHGDGNAFWNGGLYQAWKRALDINVDAYLWLNDDVILDVDAINNLCESYYKLKISINSERFILVGATRNKSGDITYTGKRYINFPFAFRLNEVKPDHELMIPIDAFNGNIVLVPSDVVREIGINDPHFRHGFGDYEYGLRASRRGISVRLMPRTLGICEENTRAQDHGYNSPLISLRKRWEIVNTPKGLPFRDWFRITRKYSGKWWPIHFLLPYRRLVLPRFLLRHPKS